MHKQTQRPLPERPGAVKVAAHGLRLLSDAAASLGTETGVSVGKAAAATQSSSRIPRVVCFPSSLLQTSDGKIVRQLLTSINNKHAAPYISSLVTLC